MISLNAIELGKFRDANQGPEWMCFFTWLTERLLCPRYWFGPTIVVYPYDVNEQITSSLAAWRFNVVGSVIRAETCQTVP